MKRFAILTSLFMAGSLAFAAPVLAAVPGNDLYGGRTVIGSIPFSESVDTTEATTDADDAEANAQCGAPATEASTWYEITAAADGGLVVDVSSSTYAAGVIVATGSPGSLSVINCGPFAVAFGTSAGQTYAILVFDFEVGAGNGGTLNITVDEIPPPPVVDVTVDPVGQFNARTGSATITGTVTCTGAADFAFIEVQLRQAVGRFTITGFGFIEFPCDGTSQSWSVEVFADNGLFKGGRSLAVTFAVACGVFDCGFDFEERVVRLRR